MTKSKSKEIGTLPIIPVRLEKAVPLVMPIRRSEESQLGSLIRWWGFLLDPMQTGSVRPVWQGRFLMGIHRFQTVMDVGKALPDHLRQIGAHLGEEFGVDVPIKDLETLSNTHASDGNAWREIAEELRVHKIEQLNQEETFPEPEPPSEESL